MKRRYMLIILGILLIGITVFLTVQLSQPESAKKETTTDNIEQQQQEKQPGYTANEQEETPEEEYAKPQETNGEPIAQLREIFSEAVQRTIDFFANREANVTALGDSLTQGVGDNVVEGGYVSILDNTINENHQLVAFDNYGKRGHRSDQLLKWLDNPEVEQSVESADIVLITIGANDIMQVVKENFTNLNMNDFTQARETYEEHLQQIFDKINDLNEDAKIYLIGIYNPFLNYFPDIRELSMIVDDWNETSRDVVEQYDNATFIPVADLFASGEKHLFADDHFHPSHQGYQLFARRILDYLTDQ